jgi:hypothetical protein
MTDSEGKSPFEEALADHRELRDQISELQQLALGPQPPADIREKIAAFHQRICSHFRREDEEGMLDDLSHRHPRAAKQIDVLQAQHGEILAGLRGLVDSPEDPDVCEKLKSILHSLVEHERAETDLMSRVETEDIGAGD